MAERLAAIAGFFAGNADALDPSVRSIVESAKGYSAVDAFEGRYAFEALRRRTEATWAEVDILLLPTSPTTYTVEEMLADPIRLNSHFGHYTNFANLLGLAAIAVPGGFGADGLPGGVTLVGPGFSDEALGPWADALHRAAASGMGIARDAVLPEASRVLGHRRRTRSPSRWWAPISRACPLNHQLTNLGGRKVRVARTSGAYRLYALPGTHPAKPGLVHEPGFAGGGLEVEIWALPPAGFGRFTAAIPAPLGIGKLTLEDGSNVSGFLCEAHAVAGAEDITIHGGWRAYLASR